MQYDDEFATCIETFASLRIVSDAIPPGQIGEMLGILPTESFAKGDVVGRRSNVRKHNAWILSTEGRIASRDTRRHIDWIVAQLAGKRSVISELRARGAEIDIMCLWVSVVQGGPILSAQQLKALGELEIDIWWDVYLAGDDEIDKGLEK